MATPRQGTQLNFDSCSVRVEPSTPVSSTGRGGASLRTIPTSTSTSPSINAIHPDDSITQLEDGIRDRWGPSKPTERKRKQSFFPGNVTLLDVKSAYTHRKKGILKNASQGGTSDNCNLDNVPSMYSNISDISNGSLRSTRSVAFKEPKCSHTLFSVYNDYKRAGHSEERGNSLGHLRARSMHAVKSLISPNQNANTLKIFGSAVEVELERKRTFDSGFVIHPLSRFKYAWDLIMLVLLLVSLYVLPLDIAFFDKYTLMPFHAVSDCICFMDIIINFRTGFHMYADKYEIRGKAIAINYLKSWFFVDLLSSLPLNYIVAAATTGRTVGATTLTTTTRALKVLKICKILNVLKLLRLLRLSRMVNDYGDAYQVTITIMRYVKLFSTMLLLCHWNGCLHYFVALLQDFPEQCWVKTNHLFYKPWYVKYGWAMFKTFSHMLVIGYGRQMPVLLSEAFVAMMTMITGATFYALLITNAVASRVSSHCSKQAYDEKVKETDEYLQNRNIPRTVHERVDEFFQQKYPQGKYVSEKEVLSAVSPPLRDSIVQHTCQYLIQKIPFLRDSTPESVFAVFAKIDSNIYLTGDIIVHEGRVGREMFFIRSGEVIIVVNEHELETLGPGTYFGEISLLTNQRRLYSVIATRPSDIMVLRKEDLDDLLEEHSKMSTLLYCAALDRLINIYRLAQHYKVDDYVLGIRDFVFDPDSNESTETAVTFYKLFLKSLETLVELKYNASVRTSGVREDNLLAQRELEKLIGDVLLHHQQSHPSCTLITHGATCGSARYRDQSYAEDMYDDTAQ